MTHHSNSYRPSRRKVLAGIATTGATVLGAPYVARAQDTEIPIGVLLPFTGRRAPTAPTCARPPRSPPR